MRNLKNLKRFFFFWLIVGLVIGLFAYGCEKKETEKVKKSIESPSLPEFLKKITKKDIEEMKKKIAVIQTNKGVIKFEFFPDVAPKTVANFINLTENGFYDGTKFHRVVAGFVIQGGDPLSKDNNPYNDGTGGPGYTIPAEFNNRPHLEGTVAMARSADPNSAGSQFYICLAPQPQLNGQYTVFGQVIEGLKVVHQIQKNDIINKITIEKK